MAEYIYDCIILKDPTDVSGFNLVVESAAKTDYEANFQSQTVKVNELVVAANSFEIDKTWTQFKNLVDGVNIQWSDVREKATSKLYELHLITNSPL